MGVRRCQQGYVGFALAVVLALVSGCQSEPARGPKVGAPLSNEPLDPGQISRATPGLEPPNSGPNGPGAPGAMLPPQAGAGATPTAPPPNSGMAMNPTGTAGAGGSTAGAAGSSPSGDAGSGMPPAMTDPDAGAGGADAGTDAGAADPCAAAPECNLIFPCGDPALHCISLDGCDHPVCITVEAACQAQCNSDDCAVLESYPEQIRCN